jgi:anti-sigma factor RsiW
MNACQEYEELLTLHATGALEPDEDLRVRTHLESCAACRSEEESTARVLADVALPAPAPAMREQMDALPRRALRAWQREQVRRAFRARTVGALLAAAAVVLLVVRPSLQRTGAPLAPVQPPAAPFALSETQSDFEQWASADPLGEELDPAVDEGGAEDWEEEAGVETSESELFLNLNTGETP